MERKPYPTDLTDEQWAILEPLVPPPAPRGRPREVDIREVINAIFYLNRGGIPWRLLPHDFPAWKTVYNYFAAWRDDGTWERMLQALRERARVAAGREPTPSACAIDSQSAQSAGAGGERGLDPAKKVKGRKRHVGVDTLGFLLAVAVTAASVDDAAAARDVFDQLHPDDFPRLQVAFVDQKYHNHGLYEWLDGFGEGRYRLEVKSRPAGAQGFVPIPKRWVVERTFAWLLRYRRHAKDYERLTESSEAMIRVSAVHLLLRRLSPVRLKRTQRFRFKRRRKPAA
jgi:putative transposase